MITNLLSNAIKYTPAGGWIKACAEPSGQRVRLIVEDSGVGIPASHIPHIFDRFYRVPDPNPEKGLGLGLSFVAAIVKAHGGEIHVTSDPGKGSRFEVLLPAGAVTQAAPARALTSQAQYASALCKIERSVSASSKIPSKMMRWPPKLTSGMESAAYIPFPPPQSCFCRRRSSGASGNIFREERSKKALRSRNSSATYCSAT